MFLKIILLGFFLYILYRFVFGFLLPVYKATQKIKKGFRDMQQQQQANASTSASQNQNNAAADSKKKEPAGEYIDFEEIK